MAVTHAHLDSKRIVVLRNMDIPSLVLQCVGFQRAELPVGGPN